MKITKARLKEIIQEELEKVLGEEELEEKSVFHACAAHVALKESGEEGTPINHTLLEDGSVTHYTIEFEDRIVEGIPADKLDILQQEGHDHGYKRDDKEHDKKKSRMKYKEELEGTSDHGAMVRPIFASMKEVYDSLEGSPGEQKLFEDELLNGLGDLVVAWRQKRDIQ